MHISAYCSLIYSELSKYIAGKIDSSILLFHVEDIFTTRNVCCLGIYCLTVVENVYSKRRFIAYIYDLFRGITVIF